MFPLLDPMRVALDAARAAAAAGEVPVGAVMMRGEQVLAVAANAPRALHDPTAHAEILAIRDAAAKLGRDRLEDCDLWVTLEPCAMCAGAIAHARIARVYYGASDPKGGAVEHGPRFFTQSTCHHRPEIYSGIGEGEAGELLRAFFAPSREKIYRMSLSRIRDDLDLDTSILRSAVLAVVRGGQLKFRHSRASRGVRPRRRDGDRAPFQQRLVIAPGY